MTDLTVYFYLTVVIPGLLVLGINLRGLILRHIHPHASPDEHPSGKPAPSWPGCDHHLQGPHPA